MTLPRLLAPAAALACLGVAVLLAVQSQRGDDPHGSSPSTRPSVTSGQIGGGAATVRSAGSPRLIVSEFHGTDTLLLSVAAGDPTDRQKLVRIDHAANWAPRPAVAPGGDLIAYAVLPPGSQSPDTEAVLWVIGLQQREPKRLAARIDARVTPSWSPDATRVVYQRVQAGGANGTLVTLEEVDVRDGKAREIAQAEPGRLFPVGYEPGGAGFYCVRFERDGAYLDLVSLDTRAARRVGRIAVGVARDFHLAPDGSAVAYLAPSGAPPHYHASIVDTASGDVRPLLPDQARKEDVGVAWTPSGANAVAVGLVVGAPEATGRVALSTGETVVESAQGFDAPVAWSPDGRYLMTRSFSGSDSDHPGREQPVLIDREGARHPLTGDGPIEFVGWVTNAP